VLILNVRVDTERTTAEALCATGSERYIATSRQQDGTYQYRILRITYPSGPRVITDWGGTFETLRAALDAALSELEQATE